MILTIRTDKPEAELAIYDDNGKLHEVIWQAHRQLGETIHLKIQELLSHGDIRYEDLSGIVFYSGPGSFTGLRIGASVAGALSSSLAISLVNSSGENWAENGVGRLKKGENESVAIVYGSDPHITQPRK